MLDIIFGPPGLELIWAVSCLIVAILGFISGRSTQKHVSIERPIPSLRPGTIVPNDGKPINLSRAFIRRTNLDKGNFENFILAQADLTGATARGADFKDADLTGAILRGVDFTGAHNLTYEQLRVAVIDDTTILPDYIDRETLMAEQEDV